MASSVRVLWEPTAIAELDDAMRWYDSRQAGVGRELGEEVDRCMERICANPQMYARVKKDYRRAFVDRFPYAVHYEYLADTIVVYSVFHGSRDPGKLDQNLP